MPMTFTEPRIDNFLRMTLCDLTGTPLEKRERAALKSEELGDFLQAWEIRTGRPWNEMTSEEARQLIQRYPRLRGNPAVMNVLSRM